MLGQRVREILVQSVDCGYFSVLVMSTQLHVFLRGILLLLKLILTFRETFSPHFHQFHGNNKNKIKK